MDRREESIRRWFDMWLQKKDTGIESCFPRTRYTSKVGGRSIGALRRSATGLRSGTRAAAFWPGTFAAFSIKKTRPWPNGISATPMDDGRMEEFDGMTLVRWSEMGQICFLQEFGCNLNRYDPYAGGDAPHFAGGAPKWF